MLRKRRVVPAVAITAFWLVMVGIFLHREGWFRPRLSAENPKPARPAQIQDQWLGIFIDGDKRVGHIHLTSTPAAREGISGFDTDLEVRLETSLFGMAAAMDLTGSAWTSEAGDRASFDFALQSGEYEMALTGNLAEKRLRATMTTGGAAIPLEFPVESGLFPGGALGMPGGGMPRLEPGESTVIQAFDPMTMKPGDARIACVGEERLTLEGVDYDARIYTTTIGTVTSKAWVSDDDEVIQASTPFGFTLKKIAAATASTSTDTGEPGDIIDSLKVRVSGVPVKPDATRMRIRVMGIDPEKLPHDPPWQRRDGDILEIQQAALPGSNPESAADVSDSFDPAPFLTGDAFVAVDHPDVIAKAREIVGDERDPWKQSLRIYTWLFENIEKVPVLGVPAALEVLRTGQGDCNEHTVLFAALARAEKIPCRIAIGLVYSDTLGGFGYHAWPEVYLGAWYPMDPTLGQIVADATHVKLLNGNLESWVQLTGFIGQMSLEVLAVE